MCGRFALSVPLNEIVKEFYVDEVEGETDPSYNIAPTQGVMVIVPHEGKRVLSRYRWGLVPHWAKDLSMGSKMINARAETVAQKASFKVPFQRQRCLIPASGFYEWKKEGNIKRPFYISLKDKNIFAFAGLFDRWQSPDNETVETCTIITTGANELVSRIHNRMPVILGEEGCGLWLDGASRQDELQKLLRPFPSENMEAFEVSPEVNSPAGNGPGCIEPL